MIFDINEVFTSDGSWVVNESSNQNGPPFVYYTILWENSQVQKNTMKPSQTDRNRISTYENNYRIHWPMKI